MAGKAHRGSDERRGAWRYLMAFVGQNVGYMEFREIRRKSMEINLNFDKIEIIWINRIKIKNTIK